MKDAIAAMVSVGGKEYKPLRDCSGILEESFGYWRFYSSMLTTLQDCAGTAMVQNLICAGWVQCRNLIFGAMVRAVLFGLIFSALNVSITLCLYLLVPIAIFWCKCLVNRWALIGLVEVFQFQLFFCRWGHLPHGERPLYNRTLGVWGTFSIHVVGLLHPVYSFWKSEAKSNSVFSCLFLWRRTEEASTHMNLEQTKTDFTVAAHQPRNSCT